MHAQSAPPYPPSPVITDWSWAPENEIRRGASGSDNFPITWGDDDRLYTAYGDGRGFEPQTEEKLSLGFAAIEGSADNFRGSNIRSPAEQMGDGRTGKKASGMLMVNGTLYMWVRNANLAGEGCQLAWSTDRAQTWTWSDWSFAEFGFCTFINFGANYAGARDDYVYTVTPDGTSAYAPADRFILMRVPQTQITDRNAYEFLASVSDAENTPTWTPNIAQRGAMFTNPGRALRSGISYNAALGRYLWWQSIREGDPDSRYEGGFGVYDAPEPWGPWTTAFYTDDWDVGPGEAGSFPTKWMSDDGRTVHLVFSGDDAFSVRRATLTLASDEPMPPTEATPVAASSGLISESYLETATPGPPVDAPPPAPPTPTLPATPTSAPAVADVATPTPVSILAPPTPTASPTMVAAPDTVTASSLPLQSPLAGPEQAAQPQSPLPSPLPTATETSAPTAAASASEANPSENVSTSESVTQSQPITESVSVTESAPATAPSAGEQPPTEPPAPTATPPPTETPLPTATPPATPTVVFVATSGTAAPEDPLAALFRLETMLLALLCLVSISVSALGFSALIVTVLYIRSRSATEQAYRRSEAELYRARRLPSRAQRWRYPE